MKRFNRIIYAFLILFLLLASGCIQQRIADKLSISFGMGFDLDGNGKIIGINSYSFYQKDKSSIYITDKAKSNTIKGMHFLHELKQGMPLAAGKLASSVFGEKLAKQGLQTVLDAYFRGTHGNGFLAVTKDPIEKIMNEKFPIQEGAGLMLEQVLHNNIETGNIPDSFRLNDFMYAYYNQGIDPILPLIAVEERKMIIKGIALFKDDQMVGQIAPHDFFVFNILHGDAKGGTVEVELSSRVYAVYHLNSSKIRYQIHMQNQVPKVIIHIQLYGDLMQYTGGKLSDGEQEDFKKILRKQIEDKGMQLVKQFQDIEVDPLGIGEKAKHQLRTWKENEWKKMCPAIPIQIKVDLQVEETGIAK